jgi:hypothetical protein
MSKRPRVTLVDVMRLANVVWPIVQVVLEGGPSTKATLEVPLRRSGKKRWQWRLDGAPALIVDGSED